jgi:multidrug efflux pump subunit AcrB
MQGEFFPASDRPELLVSLTLPANASQPETLREVEKLEKALAGNSNIDRFSTYVGSGAIRFYLPMDVLLENENIAQMVVVAKDLEARDRLHAQLNRILATQFSDIITRVSPLELGPPVGWPIKYRVSGPDYLQVRALANRLTDAIGRSPFSRDVNQTAGEPERVITLKVNQTAARAAGISSESLARTLNTVWSGSVVTSIRDNDRLVDVVLRARTMRVTAPPPSPRSRFRGMTVKNSAQRRRDAGLGRGRSGHLASPARALYHGANGPCPGAEG